MGFVFLVSVLFRGPLTFLILVGGIGGQEGIKMTSASTPSANEPANHFSPNSTAKTNDKSTNLCKNCINDVAFASVHSEKTRLKKLIVIIIIIEKLFTRK